jgi:hypothetical protein
MPATSDDRPDRYEVTVRFRDGTAATFEAAERRAWRPGSRVNVIAGHVRDDALSATR